LEEISFNQNFVMSKSSPNLIDIQLEDLEEEERFFDISRVKKKIKEYVSYFEEVPNIIRYLIKIFSSREEFFNSITNLVLRINSFPIVIFYKYLWGNKRYQFFLNIFVNYIFPMVFSSFIIIVVGSCSLVLL
jgi:hypothetical protein